MLVNFWGWFKEFSTSLVGFFNELFSWLGDALYWLLSSFAIILEWVLDSLVYLIKGVGYLFLDGVLVVMKTFISAIDVSAFAVQFAAGYGLIPSQAAYFMCAIGFPQFVTIIAVAYGIRFAMNTIPDVELFGNKVSFPKL